MPNDIREAFSQDRFDLVFDQSFSTDSVNPELTPSLEKVLSQAKLSFRTPNGSNYYTTQYGSAHLEDWGDLHLQDQVRSLPHPYDHAQRFISFLGLKNPLPLEVGSSLLVHDISPEVSKWWSSKVLSRREHPKQQVILLSPFGGSYPEKGFIEQEDYKLIELVTGLLKQDALVLLSSNGTAWGSKKRVQHVASQVKASLRKYLITDIPTPQEHKTFQLQLMKLCDHYIGVEGGGGQLAFTLCPHMTLMLLASSGFQQWMPLLRGPKQRDIWIEGEWRKS